MSRASRLDPRTGVMLAGGGGGTKSSTDPAVADQLLARIDEISKIFWETKQG